MRKITKREYDATMRGTYRYEPTQQGLQAVAPGCERSAVQAAAAREAAGHGRKRSRKPQREPGGMFDLAPSQPTLF